MPSTRAIWRLLTPCWFSSKIAVRWDWLNIGFFLLGQAFRQTVQLVAEVLDLPAHRLALRVIHLGRSRPNQSSVGALEEGGGYVQIAPQSGGPGRGSGWFGGRLGFEKQLGLVEKALAGQGRAVTPGGIQLPGLSRVAVMLNKNGSHPLAVVQADARDRHQKLHGHVGGDSALTHLLLDDLRQKIHQGQPSRDPTQAAIKATRQLFLSVAVALLQLRQQPTFFQRRLVWGEAQRAVQHQGFGFAQWPDHRFHRVPAQLVEGRQALVTVDDHITVHLADDRHHHDRRLLPHFRQRGQQLPLPSGRANPQVLPTPIQLVELQAHLPAPLRRRGLVWMKRYLVLFARRGKCVRN
jgi:hypothetical protein